MKASSVVMLSAVAGCVFGVAITAANFADNPPPEDLAVANGLAVRGPGAPEVLVDAQLHDFGVVERDITISHTFQFTNLGRGALKLRDGGTTCTKCTIAEIPQGEVAKGETVGVRVDYHTSYAQPRIRQTATVLTNDPVQPRVELVIEGIVTTKYRAVPDSLVFSKVSATETTSTEVKIYSYLSDEVEVVGHSFGFPDLAPYFEVNSEPVPKDQIAEPGAKSGCRVTVVVKPGLPWGPILQTIRLELRMPGDTENTIVVLPVSGRVDSDISIVGAGWNAVLNRLYFGTVRSQAGASRKLHVLVRGPLRHQVHIKTASLEPAWLKASVGEPQELNNATVQVPVTIEIPPGMPTVNHLGTDQGKLGELVLETTHPQIQQLRVHLQFLIEQ